MNKKNLECPYCKSIITKDDTTCPKCGANCNEEIKKFKEEEEKERKEQVEKVQKQIKIPFIIVFGFAIFGFILVGSIMLFSFSSIRRSYPQIRGITDGQLKTENFTVSIDKFEEYEYHDDFFKDCNTREGYKRMAFYIVYKNNGDEKIATSSFKNDLIVKADNEVLTRTSIKANSSFCEVVKGKEEYTAFPITEVLPKDSVAGYIGYEVPINAKKIKFIFSNTKMIEIDNPVYQES